MAQNFIDFELQPRQSKVELALKEAASTFDPNLTQAQAQEMILERTKHILEYYGYYKSDVQLSWVTQKLKVTVNLNAPVIIEAIYLDIQGPGVFDEKLAPLKQISFLKPNEIFEHPKYESFKEFILTRVTDAGYLKADFSTHEVILSLDKNTAEINLILDTGPLHYFNTTQFPESYFCESLLKRFIPYYQNQSYSTNSLVALQDGLVKSNYFNNVIVEPIVDDSANSNVVDVKVNLEPARPNQYQFGLGYGTDTGARGLARWKRRYLNPYGHKFFSEFNLSEIRTRIDTSYIIPGSRPATDELQFKLRLDDDKFDEKPARLFEAEIKEIRAIGKWHRTLSFLYLNEVDKNLVNEPKRSTEWLLPSLMLSTVRSDSHINPEHGKSAYYTIKTGYELTENNKFFVQPHFKFRWLHASSLRTSWLLRTELGATLPDKAERLPLSQRFFAGGDTSIRGFDYRSLPKALDEEGNSLTVGGGYLGLASIELRHMLKHPFGVHCYVDTGNAFRNRHDPIEVGVGAGIQYQTPLGLIKASMAYPITQGADKWRPHIQFGTEL